MGDWSITIRGTGAHGAGASTDADTIARKFYDELNSSGTQVVTSAKFTSFVTTSSDVDLTVPEPVMEAAPEPPTTEAPLPEATI